MAADGVSPNDHGAGSHSGPQGTRMAEAPESRHPPTSTAAVARSWFLPTPHGR
ncbi:hypothetical protein TVNIR_2044 [Thioalkalivibrio nitratireducens DSM 14787]|uniref:Uncharacterized protein n=1 Tax=Thioalkalivibrio nitratireducens (strain DSM 14787 / UNIQEM 213 / ALEN2) TaxID=1255043 RepID=L0DXD0_THIND|nr:hypothetical protein TVNIR_2044 [Thioalkalivibrio nitratireducens DSM 14787]